MILVRSPPCFPAFGSRAGRSTCRCTPTVATPKPSGSVTPRLPRLPERCGSPICRPEETVALARQLGGADADPVPVRQRVGTRLWLGDKTSRSTTATVLDVHEIKRGERAGYRQRVCPADGWIVVVAGGTSHGIGMEAPTSAKTMRHRAIAFATGSLAAAGLALSPYTINGKKRWFLEPPHMQSSQVFLPRKERPPRIGQEVPVELRLTTATVDYIDWTS